MTTSSLTDTARAHLSAVEAAIVDFARRDIDGVPAELAEALRGELGTRGGPRG